ncbi:dynamin family protein [Brevibacillus humidisoli]|uniref:dynamin family protein n=1 Tax=Brevibacillus humidisoli TaxID=2895522 RepID=UPI001E2A51C7|nr:dynamin family protein [Brevibacillus humidisoli]UFJ39431.1 dynamin family protein [Brevibacillus humidisoli]
MNLVQTKLLDTAERLRLVSAEIAGLPGMQTQSQSLIERAERLGANRFTVALFGAFSAGKSSFANALLGDMVLPVSPNPTTAAINKIMPPTDDAPHGTVRVLLKTAEAMESDIKRSLAVFEIVTDDLQSGLDAVGSIDVSQIAPTAKPHYTFLKAVIKGWPEMADLLGGEQVVDMKAFKGFVAKEEKACFVELVELFYECPLTAQGITLVDTPGADSINARHTGVAFDYMKNADAVLFVTYYNHAFSQADREFLLQMGRVKETFELDKMFFIVNAADLAASPEELSGVLSHVEKNLLACGIRHPRIYPLSSQTALLAKLHEKGKLSGSAEKVYRQRTGTAENGPLPAAERALALSGLPVFEQDFLRFTLEELTQMAVEAAESEMRRASSNLAEMISLAEQGEEVRSQRREELSEVRRQTLETLDSFLSASVERELDSEREELLYYVKQRIFFRFAELFQYAFNPSVLVDDGRNLKQVLKSCLQELLRSVSYDLAQELRATSLRLEKFLNGWGVKLIDQWSEQLASHAPGFRLSPYTARRVQTPAFDEELSSASLPHLQAALSLFKNTKDFFERDGKQKLREELEKLLQEPVSSYLQEGGERLAQTFAFALARMIEEERARAARQVEEYFTGLIAALEMKVDMADLRQRQQRLAELLG